MTPRSIYNQLSALAAFALCSTIALAQSTPAQQAPAQPATAAPAAPIERQPTSNSRQMPGMRPGMMRPGMGQGMRPGMNQGMRPGMGPGMMQGRRIVPGNARGAAMMQHRGNVGGFRGEQGGGMDAGFRIAPAGVWWRSPAVVQRLALTADQTKKMDGIFEQSRLQLIDLKANVEKQNAMLEPLLSANPPDTTKAMAQIDKVAEARAELEKANAKMLLGLRGVLTPDQWTKLHAGRGAGGFGGPGAVGAQSSAPSAGGAGRGPGGPVVNRYVSPTPQY